LSTKKSSILKEETVNIKEENIKDIYNTFSNSVTLEPEIPNITLGDAIKECIENVENLEFEIEDLVKILEPVLTKFPTKLSVPDPRICEASLRTKNILALNDKLQKIRATVYNLNINLGV
jgi:hypothetical protein